MKNNIELTVYERHDSLIFERPEAAYTCPTEIVFEKMDDGSLSIDFCRVDRDPMYTYLSPEEITKLKEFLK